MDTFETGSAWLKLLSLHHGIMKISRSARTDQHLIMINNPTKFATVVGRPQGKMQTLISIINFI